MSTTLLPPILDEVEEIGKRVIGCAINVHRILGPGFKEVIYQRALCLELEEAGLTFESEKRVVVPYKRWEIEGHRLDLVIGGCVIAELKVVPRVRELHRRQVLSYLKATGLRLGYVLNFNSAVMRDGIRRVVL